MQSFRKLRNVDPDYETRDIYTLQFAPDQPNLRDGPSLGQMHLNFMDRLRALPGVTAVGVVNNLPLDEGTGNGRFLTDNMSADAGGSIVEMNFAGGDYFRVMGIKLLQGRTFTKDEAVMPNSSVIVSRSTATKLWPDQDPVGQRIRRDGTTTSPAFTEVGVVEDVKQDDWREAGQAVL